MSSFISVINVCEPIISIHGCSNFNNSKYNKDIHISSLRFLKTERDWKKFLSGVPFPTCYLYMLMFSTGFFFFSSFNLQSGWRVYLWGNYKNPGFNYVGSSSFSLAVRWPFVALNSLFSTYKAAIKLTFRYM